MVNVVPDIVISNSYENKNHLELLTDLAAAAKLIQIVCPFITQAGCGWLLNRMKIDPKPRVELITELNPRALLSGSLEIAALQSLLGNQVDLRSYGNKLHAKVYIFDQKTAVITSANMTNGGLTGNFEMGVVLRKEHFNVNIVTDAYSLDSGLATIWKDLYNRTEKVNESNLRLIETVLVKNQLLIDQNREAEKEIAALVPSNEYARIPKKCGNPSTFISGIGQASLFQGFAVSNWDVFDYDEPLTENRLGAYKHRMTDDLEPVLGRFHTQLSQVSNVADHIKRLNRGFSKNQQARNFYPRSKYLYLTSPDHVPSSRKHIGFPTIILGVGKDHDGRKYLEVRTGIEEEYLNQLSDRSRSLINRILAEPAAFLRRINTLGDGWVFSHGVNQKGEGNWLSIGSLELPDITALQSYVDTNDPADLSIRRRYHWDDPAHKELLGSAKIMDHISKDYTALVEFFNYANEA